MSLVSASIDQNLKYGQTNTEVRELQDFLVDKGLLTQSTGFFGLLTLKAVQKYQTSVNLPSTGYVGAMTRSSINGELSDAIASSTEAAIAEEGTSTPIGDTPVLQTPVVSPIIVATPPPAPITPRRSFKIVTTPWQEGVITPVDVYIYADDLKVGSKYNIDFHEKTGDSIVSAKYEVDPTNSTNDRDAVVSHAHFTWIWMKYKGDILTATIQKMDDYSGTQVEDTLGTVVINKDGIVN